MTQQLRADAQRNLARVLDAAAEVFAERGPDASIDEIARRAGVGHATVFRRFPTKNALIRAVIRDRLAELTGLARAALAAEDAGAAFTDFVWTAMELHARDRRLYECLDRCLKEEEGQELEALTARIVARAQKAGALRRDVAPADVQALIGGAMRAAPPEQWRLYVGVVLNGLRPPKSELSST
jgi:AcrR family transcriptional regulator